jgi:hypothetical protein
MKQGQARALALFAIVGQWVFTLVWLVAPLWQDHYRPIDQAVSEMGGGTANLPWLVNGGMLVWGVSILACAAALSAVLPRDRWRPAILATLALAGVAIIVAAIAHVDCSATVSRACFESWNAGHNSWHDAVHDWAARVFGVLLALSALSVAATLRKRRPALAAVPAIGGALGLAWTVLGLTWTPKFDAHAHYGIYQRFWILQATGWIVLLAAAVLLQLEEGRARQPGWASAAPRTWSAGRPTQPSA